MLVVDMAAFLPCRQEYVVATVADVLAGDCLAAKDLLLLLFLMLLARPLLCRYEAKAMSSWLGACCLRLVWIGSERPGLADSSQRCSPQLVEAWLGHGPADVRWIGCYRKSAAIS